MKGTACNFTSKGSVKVETGAMGLLCSKGFIFKTTGRPLSRRLLT